MSGKTQSPQALAHRFLIWATVAVFLVVTTGCGDAATPTAAPSVAPGPLPTETPTVAPTSTPVATPTPTEIPIVLPTATPPNPPLPPTENFFQVPFTSAPTSTPVPTNMPAPSVTPYVPPIVSSLSIYQKPLVGPYNALDYVLPPTFATQCIVAQHMPPPTPTPLPTPTPVPSGVLVVINNQPTPTPTFAAIAPTPVVDPSLAAAPANAWVSSFETRWYTNQRLNSVRIPAPTFTPIPTNTPVPTSTPLPFNTPDVFTGLTPAPSSTPTQAPAPTKAPPQPTWTPSLSQRFTSTGSPTTNFIQSIFISDVTALLPGSESQPTNFVVMWQVMNDLTLAMVNVDTPMEVYLRAYENYLDKTIQTVLSRSLKDASLAPTGEQRYANRKMIIGNVPDLRAFRYFSPCFNDDKLVQTQQAYNNVIARVAAKYPGRVYVADLAGMNWKGNPQWITPQNGLELTKFGADAVADTFGRIFERLLPSL